MGTREAVRSILSRAILRNLLLLPLLTLLLLWLPFGGVWAGGFRVLVATFCERFSWTAMTEVYCWSVATCYWKWDEGDDPYFIRNFTI